MEHLEQIVVRDCMRVAFREIGYESLDPQVVDALRKVDPQIDRRNAIKYVHNQNLQERMELRISEASLILMKPYANKIYQFYADRGERKSADIIIKLLTEDENWIIDKIFRNWSSPASHGNDVLQSGVYQIFRRYKPTREERINKPQYQDDQNHPIICELAYVDSDSMECVMITAERNVHWGALYINHQNILYVLTQRPSQAQQNGVHQRFYAVKLEGAPPTIYSGLCIKSGHSTKMPIASECIFIKIPETAAHTALHEELIKYKNESWGSKRVPTSSVIREYLTDIPPEDDESSDDNSWKRVRYVKDFPMLNQMASADSYGVIMLRESLRTLPASTLRDQRLKNPLRVFRQR